MRTVHSYFLDFFHYFFLSLLSSLLSSPLLSSLLSSLFFLWLVYLPPHISSLCISLAQVIYFVLIWVTISSPMFRRYTFCRVRCYSQYPGLYRCSSLFSFSSFYIPPLPPPPLPPPLPPLIPSTPAFTGASMYPTPDYAADGVPPAAQPMPMNVQPVMQKTLHATEVRGGGVVSEVKRREVKCVCFFSTTIELLCYFKRL